MSESGESEKEKEISLIRTLISVTLHNSTYLMERKLIIMIHLSFLFLQVYYLFGPYHAKDYSVIKSSVADRGKVEELEDF